MRETVRDAFIDRANEIMKQAGVNWVIAGPIVREIVDLVIKKKL